MLQMQTLQFDCYSTLHLITTLHWVIVHNHAHSTLHLITPLHWVIVHNYAHLTLHLITALHWVIVCNYAQSKCNYSLVIVA